MKEELDEKLVNKYPKIFKDRHGNMNRTAMCWGMSCNDGWYWLLDNLCSTIQSYIDNNSTKIRIKNKFARFFMKWLWSLKRSNWKYLRKKLTYNFIDNIERKFKKEEYETIPQVIATQVKEKFGSLRFYYNGGNEKIDGMVWLAEHMSYSICEDCGTTENIGQTKGWISTLCGECGKRGKNWEKYKND